MFLYTMHMHDSEIQFDGAAGHEIQSTRRKALNNFSRRLSDKTNGDELDKREVRDVTTRKSQSSLSACYVAKHLFGICHNEEPRAEI